MRGAEVTGLDISAANIEAANRARDRKALADRKRPLLHLHLVDRAAGIGQLLTALG